MKSRESDKMTKHSNFFPILWIQHCQTSSHNPLFLPSPKQLLLMLPFVLFLILPPLCHHDDAANDATKLHSNSCLIAAISNKPLILFPPCRCQFAVAVTLLSPCWVTNSYCWHHHPCSATLFPCLCCCASFIVLWQLPTPVDCCWLHNFHLPAMFTVIGCSTVHLIVPWLFLAAAKVDCCF